MAKGIKNHGPRGPIHHINRKVSNSPPPSLLKGNFIDKIKSISIAWGRQGHTGGVRGPKRSSGGPR